MVNENANSIEYKELYAQYDWFKKTYPPVIQQSCDEFFLPGFKFELVGISKNINTLMDKDSYFVTKIRIDKQHDMFFRTSEKAIGIILDRVLGKSGRRFNLNKLTDLEAKVITSFNDYLFNATSSFLAPPPPTLKRTNFDIVHLTFFIKDIEENTVSKFIISLPAVLLKPDTVVSKGEKFDYSDFKTSTLDVTIKIGSTRFSVFDLKNLDTDDIVVFDNSNSKHLKLKFKDYEKDININPNLGLVIPVDNEGGDNMGTENTNLWDSIEVEMDAQFDSVKITLGELKNIEEGLVVDLTSIYDNKVTLSVEDKPIARGELVIVNDRYGVKIDEVIAKSSKNKSEVSEENEVQEQDEFNEMSSDDEFDNSADNVIEEPQNNSEEDEFDYSDFELEDEDI
ncbi:MAG: FliM/FliN family flagellar motor switch protein [Candidatus Gastranaerophilaceae bacterium]